MVNDLMVDGLFAICNVDEVFLDVGDAGLEALEGGELFGYACGEGGCG
jgi:hypothetical protein